MKHPNQSQILDATTGASHENYNMLQFGNQMLVSAATAGTDDMTISGF